MEKVLLEAANKELNLLFFTQLYTCNIQLYIALHSVVWLTKHKDVKRGIIGRNGRLKLGLSIWRYDPRLGNSC